MGRRSHRDTSNRSHDFDPLNDLEIETPRSIRGHPPVRVPNLRQVPSQVEDRRRWAPEEVARGPAREPPRDAFGRDARITHQPKASPRVIRGPGGKPLQSRYSVWSAVEKASPRFAEARKAIICFKRKVRREVLHALKLKRSGAGAKKKRNEYSDVECT